MKALCFAIGLIFVLVVPVFAVDINLRWDSVSGASGYRIYMSLDTGNTWDAGVDVGDVTTYIYSGVSETGLVLFKVAAYNAAGESVSDWRGAWYDHTKLPIDYPSGLGVE